jgi:glycosyltransferase involved in cell wall biosynthesis
MVSDVRLPTNSTSSIQAMAALYVRAEGSSISLADAAPPVRPNRASSSNRAVSRLDRKRFTSPTPTITEYRFSTAACTTLRTSAPMAKVRVRLPRWNRHLAELDCGRGRVEWTALAKLDYHDYEVLVIDNNTNDELLWRPIETLCRKLGSRFRFFHLESWFGFKAGALNFALTQASPAADLIAVVDADYEVHPAFLRAGIGYFSNPNVGFVQAPQDYRGGDRSAFAEACYWEYRQFFAVGMMLRNTRNAILLHGTMGLVRRRALDEVGGWAEWCMTEDSELGLRLLARGYRGLYMPQTMGRGLLPLSYRSYRRQRRRWVIGGVQTLRRHWKMLLGLPGATGRLTMAQRLHYYQGWVPWFRDAIVIICMVFALFLGFAALLGASAHVLAPVGWGMAAVFTHFVVRHVLIYRYLLCCSWRQTLGATTEGCLKQNFSFQRTPKSTCMERALPRHFRHKSLLGVVAFAALAGALFGLFRLGDLITAATLSTFVVILLASARMDQLERVSVWLNREDSQPGHAVDRSRPLGGLTEWGLLPISFPYRNSTQETVQRTSGPVGVSRRA